MMYDDEGNLLSDASVSDDDAAAGKKKKGRRKGKKRRASELEEEPQLNAGRSLASPFAAMAAEDTLLGSGRAAVAVTETDICKSFDHDALGDDVVPKQVKTSADKKAELATQKAKEEYHAKCRELAEQKLSEKKAKAKERKQQPDPMGHFSHAASDEKGLIFDGIYQWTKTGLGKTPLKVKKQWQGVNENVNPKRSRKQAYVHRD